MITSLACAFAVSTLFAALEPLAPCDGKTVQLVPDAQEKVMNLPTLEVRIGLFAEDCATGGKISRDPNWRKSLPLVLEVKTTKGEKGPWKVMIGRKSDLSDARVWYLPTAGAGAAVGREIVNGVLGVSRHEMETDWESTFYPDIPDEHPDPDFWCRESHFNNGFAKYGDAGTPWNERVVLYLEACGITDDEIRTFREIMLERFE